MARKTLIQTRRDTAANWTSGNPTPAAGEPCFDTTNKRLKIGDGATAYESMPDLSRIPLTTITVGASRCDYTTVYDARAAILGLPSASNQYCIVLHGNVTETNQIAWLSYVHLLGNGAVWTLNHTFTDGLAINNCMNAVIRDVIIKRTGSTAAAAYAVRIGGASDNTVILNDVTIEHNITAAVSDNPALVVYDTAAPQILNSRVYNNTNKAGGHGIIVSSTGDARIINCYGVSGTLNSSNGINWTSNYGTMINCYGHGRGTNSSRGINTNTKTIGCIGVSAASGTEAYGIAASGNAILTGCLGIGGDVAASAGIATGSANLSGCTAIPGSVNGSYGFYVAGCDSPNMVGCKTSYKSLDSYLSYTGSTYSANLMTGKPYFLVRCLVYVTVAATGDTDLHIGTSDGGDEIALVNIGSTGYKYFDFPVTGFASGASIYYKPDDTSARFYFYYTVRENYTTNYSLYLDTYGYARISDCQLLSNQASSGIYITANCLTANNYVIANCHIGTAGTSGVYDVDGASAGSGNIKNCAFSNNSFNNVVPHRLWTTWTPTLTWGTADPDSITTVARYMRDGTRVCFHVDISSADSNAASSLTITLPVDPVDNNDYTSVSSREIAGGGGATWSDPLAYINMDSADKKINFAAFTTGTDDQAIRILVSGSYEVA